MRTPETGAREATTRGLTAARGLTDWQRNCYGEFSPVPCTPGDEDMLYGSSDVAISSGRAAGVRHCHKQRSGSLMDKVARRQLVAVVVLCTVFMIGEGVGESV
ncbi:uncharacterized protein LOC101860072, partial [Aplysia californica]|uniref:Uncharacterized protein LOC101860072 n=1 Tax=Aplysia californica TaxID=6500 RepID=A0ABM0KAX7_APLCA